MNNPTTFTLELEHPIELFHVPDPDPFSDRPLFEPGLETIYHRLQPLSLLGPARVVLRLPEAALVPGLAEKIRAAVDRFAAFRIRQNQDELAALRWKGLKALQNGLLFLAVCLVGASLAAGAESLPEFLRGFLSEGLTIAGWVSLWHPVEVLLYEWWPAWRENRIYAYMQRLEWVLEPRIMIAAGTGEEIEQG